MHIRVRAKPGSKVNAFGKSADGMLVVKIKAPAHDGKANKELLCFLSEKLNLPGSRIRIAAGFTSPFKKIEIDADENYVREKLGLL